MVEFSNVRDGLLNGSDGDTLKVHSNNNYER